MGGDRHFSSDSSFITGDGEYFQNGYKIPAASRNQRCFSCFANKSDVPHNDYRATAAWRSTIIKHQGTCPTVRWIASVPGVVGESFAYDLLHVVDEGVASHICANVMFDLVITTQEARPKTLTIPEDHGAVPRTLHRQFESHTQAQLFLLLQPREQVRGIHPLKG